jgi:membrane protein DedA with SNARE-associated domain
VTTFGQLVAALASLLVVVLLGAVVPIVPTGAAVSAAAVVAWHRDGYTVLAVVAVGALAAYGGDAIMFALCRAGGEALTRRVRLSRRPIQLAETMKTRIERAPVPALLVSRLVPAGRIPMLLAAAVVGVSWRRFAVANVTACAVWSAMYASIGLFGGAVFPEPWQGVLAAIVLVLALSYLWSRVQDRRQPPPQPPASRTSAEVSDSTDGAPRADGSGAESARSPRSSSQRTN